MLAAVSSVEFETEVVKDLKLRETMPELALTSVCDSILVQENCFSK